MSLKTILNDMSCCPSVDSVDRGSKHTIKQLAHCHATICEEAVGTELRLQRSDNDSECCTEHKVCMRAHSFLVLLILYHSLGVGGVGEAGVALQG